MVIPEVSPWLDEAELAAVQQSLADNWISEGPRTAEFAARLNALMDVPFGVFAPNGTLALYLALLGLEIGPGDEVIVPDTTFIASANAVLMAGARPVFAEVNRRNYQIDVAQCARLVNERTRAILPVHLFGMAADMAAVMPFARAHGLKVVEDAAQAIGVYYRGQHAGTFGDAGCFSFFADKTITTGEGGYVVCRDRALYERLRLLRNQGRPDRGTFIHPAIGFNFRITDLQAAIGLAQLNKLDEIIRRKGQILARYQTNLAGLDDLAFLELEPGSTYVPFRVVLFCPKAHDLMVWLSEQGIQSRAFFYPMHLQPCFAHLRRASDVFLVNAMYGYGRGICLPVFPALESCQVDEICDRVSEFYRGVSRP